MAMRERVASLGPFVEVSAGDLTSPAGDTVTFRVNDEQGGSGHGVRVFAGPRWDPFIMDAPAMLKTIATGELAFTEAGERLVGQVDLGRRCLVRVLLGDLDPLLDRAN